MSIQPYVFFEGRAEEAAAYYVQHLGAAVTQKMHFRDNPDPSGCANMPPNSGDKIMHMELTIGDSVIMASDGGCSGAPQISGVSLAHTVETPADADRIFAALADGGTVQMPIGETFFSPRFGMVQDRFGVWWMIMAKPAV